jgi:DegV family protein with EDD domain
VPKRRVEIVTDVAADQPTSVEILWKRYGIRPVLQVPLGVSFGDESYLVGIDLNTELFKKRLHETRLIPTTAAMTPEFFKDVYRPLLDEGKEIVSIHLGENMSRQGVSAREAVAQLGTDRITVFNTGTLSGAQMMMVAGAERAAADGASRKEIITLLDDLKTRIDLRAVPTLPFLRKGGRLTRGQEIFASLLDIKPLVQIDNGQIIPATKEKIRTMGKAMNWLVGFARSRGTLEQVEIVDLEAQALADTLKTRLIKELGIPENIIYRGELGPIGGSHGGPGTVGMITMRRV